MLEPWSRRLKWLRKLIYFHLMEKRMAKRAAVVRAVSKPEMANLKKDFKNVAHIPNGAEIFKCYSEVTKPVTLLFLGRLNSKKCVYEILRAWIDSKASQRTSRINIVFFFKVHAVCPLFSFFQRIPPRIMIPRHGIRLISIPVCRPN